MKLKPRTKGGTLYVHFTASDGRRMRVSTGTADETEAQLKALAIVREHLVDLPQDAAEAASRLDALGDLLRDTWHRRWAGQKARGQRKTLVTKITREIGH